MSDLIILENITKFYNQGKSNEVKALKDINLKIKEGDSLAIMGVSGSGKSTLLNIIGAMDAATSGKYYFNNQEVTNMKENELAKFRGDQVGFVLQSYGLLPNEKVVTNIGMPLYFSDTKVDAKEEINSVLRKLHIEDLAKRKVKELSGGQKQRVAIARAIIKKPIFLF